LNILLVHAYIHCNSLDEVDLVQIILHVRLAWTHAPVLLQELGRLTQQVVEIHGHVHALDLGLLPALLGAAVEVVCQRLHREEEWFTCGPLRVLQDGALELHEVGPLPVLVD